MPDEDPTWFIIILDLLSECLFLLPRTSKDVASALPPPTRFQKHRKLKKAHMRGQRTLFNGRRFSFLTATGKNINTGGWAAARLRGPGRRAQARERRPDLSPGAPGPDSRSQVPGVRPVEGAHGRSEGTLRPRAKAPGCETFHPKLHKLGHKLRRVETKARGAGKAPWPLRE